MLEEQKQDFGIKLEDVKKASTEYLHGVLKLVGNSLEEGARKMIENELEERSSHL